MLFASWALTAVAGTLWACSASITPSDGPDGGGGNPGDDASMGDDSSLMPGDDSGMASETAPMGDAGKDGGGELALCGATTTYDTCTACCDSFHPGGGDVIPVAAHACTCMKGSAAIRLRECANQCSTTYCDDAGIKLPDAGSTCDICLNKALAGDAGDASAGVGSRPGDCLGPAFAACSDSPACVGYQKCYAAANCDPKP